MLSTFQHAVLQELGVVLWKTPTETAPTSQESAKPLTESHSVSKHDRLAALKAQLGKEKPPVTESSTRPLSEEQRQLPIVRDIQLASGALSLSILIGEKLSVDKATITLPSPPEKLTASDKKSLWIELAKIL